MGSKSWLELERESFMAAHGREPGASELMQAWEAMIEKPAYADFVHGQMILREGHNPMPDLRSLEVFLRAVGHELAATDVLKPSSFLGQMLNGRGAWRENYQGLHWAIVARLLDSQRLLARSEIEILYSTMDRLLNGGRDWTKCNRVQTANRKFYLALWNTKFPLMHRVVGHLNPVIKIRGAELFGDSYKILCTAGQAAQDFLAVAIAVKKGHKVVTVQDAMDGAWTYASLFDVDLRSLPLVVRDGRSGYEKDVS